MLLCVSIASKSTGKMARIRQTCALRRSFTDLVSCNPKAIAWPQDALPTHPDPPPPPPPQTALPATGGNATGKESSIIVRAEDAAGEGAGAREPAHTRARVMEGDARESAQGSVSALEKGEGGGIQARGAGGKGKRQLNVT
jgi:hypothetical protein